MPRPRGGSLKSRPVTEGMVEHDVVAFYQLHGGIVYQLSQGFRGVKTPDGRVVADRRGTRQTPGIADLEIFFPGPGVLVKHETKTPAGEALHQRMLRRPLADVPASQRRHWIRAHAQHLYEQHCRVCGVAYARGGVPEAKALVDALNLKLRGPNG